MDIPFQRDATRWREKAMFLGAHPLICSASSTKLPLIHQTNADASISVDIAISERHAQDFNEFATVCEPTHLPRPPVLGDELDAGRL
ncbi:hypothetical protein [Teichococcus wenyumeiae]|uniref:hypothetical protein n=1 Tax=Teichococcus wenyumeiae TaxID=2478470 RepID=UPI0011C44F56|nr:hypothetical protein [Pseudoroseomonas wenyumeiae]